VSTHIARHLVSLDGSGAAEPLGAVESLPPQPFVRWSEVTGVTAEDRAVVRFPDDGTTREALLARHLDVAWLKAACAVAPVPASVLAHANSPVLGVLALYPRAEHSSVVADVIVSGATITLRGTDGVRIEAASQGVAVKAEGPVVIQGGEIVSRADGAYVIRGATVHLN
jgi:hypothetical protein